MGYTDIKKAIDRESFIDHSPRLGIIDGGKMYYQYQLMRYNEYKPTSFQKLEIFPESFFTGEVRMGFFN